jgi:DNA gyrase/topoisomerase IV subunit A
MIRKSDVQWWLLEVKKHPESAPEIVEELAGRLVELDAENERLRNELLQRRQRPTTGVDSDEVSALRQKVATLESLLSGETSGDPFLVLLSRRFHAARVPLAHAHRLAAENQPLMERSALVQLRCLLPARLHEELLLLSNEGHGFRHPLADVPLLAGTAEWPATEATTGEWLTAAAAAAQPPRFWTIVTRRGYVRQLLRIELERDVEQGKGLLASPFRRDEPVAAVSGDQGDLLILTRWGQAIRFPQRSIERQGNVAIELDADDEVVTALPLPSDMEILLVTANGYAMRRDTAQVYSRSHPGGGGSSLMQAFDVLAAFPYQPRTKLLFLTYSGKLSFIPADDVPLHHRTGKGTPMRDFSRDPAVAAALIPATA